MLPSHWCQFIPKCTCIYGLFRKLWTLKTGWPNFCCDSINCLSHDDPQKTKCTQLLCSHNCFTKEFKIRDHLKSSEMENFTLIIIQYAPSSSSSSSLFYVFKILNSMIKECNLTDAKFFVCPKNPHEDIYSCSKTLNLQYS